MVLEQDERPGGAINFAYDTISALKVNALLATAARRGRSTDSLRIACSARSDAGCPARAAHATEVARDDVARDVVALLDNGGASSG
jgi:hypothetical protein